MSWKRSGGIKQFDGINNLNVNSIVTDDFVMREAYKGTFTISGELFVSEDCSLNANVHVNDTVTVGNDLYVANRVYIGENENARRFLDSTPQGLGMNLENPVSLLDISGSNDHIIHVFSDQTKVKSTLVQNVDKNQGVLLLDTSMGALQWFFPDSSANFIYDASNVEFTVDKDWISKEAFRVLGNTTLESILLVKQDSTMEGNLHVMGELTLDGKLNLNGDLSMNGNLSVGGESQFNDIMNTNDIAVETSRGIYWKQYSTSKPVLRIRDYEGTEPNSFFKDGFEVESKSLKDTSLVVDNDLFITGNLYIGDRHNVSLENQILDSNNIFLNLRGTDVSHVYINYGKTTSGGEGLYFYNQSIGNTALQDGFVKVSHIDQGKLSFRSTGVRDVVSLNFNQLNDNGKQTGLVVLDRIESGYSDTSDNYDIISSHAVSTIDVNSSLTNINHIETVSLSGDTGVFNISCTTQDLYVNDISAANTIDASFITVHNVEGGRIQTNDFSAVNVTIDGITNVNGNSTFYSDIVAKEYFRGNHLTLSGDAIFDQDIHVYGDINAYKDISLNGNIKLNGTLFVSDTVTIGSSSENETLLVKNNITIGLDAVNTDHTVTISGDISLNGAIYGDSIQLKNAAHMKSIVMDGTDTLDLSSSSIVFNYNDNIITLSNELLSFLQNISGDVQQQISDINTTVNVGAAKDNIFSGNNTFSGNNQYTGDVSATIIDVTDRFTVYGNTILSGHVKIDSGDISATNLTVQGNTFLSGNVLVNSDKSVYEGTIDIIGKEKSERDDVYQDSSSDGKNSIRYFQIHEKSALSVKNNITCIGEDVVKYRFVENDTAKTLEELRSAHINYLNNEDQFFTDYNNSLVDFLNPSFGTLEISTVKEGGEIECLKLTPRDEITLSGDTMIVIGNTTFTSNRLKKALELTNESSNSVNLTDIAASSLTLTGNTTVINGNGIVTNSLNSTGSVSAPSLESNTISASTAQFTTLVYTNIIQGGDVTSVVTSTSQAIEIYRSGLVESDGDFYNSQSGGIIVKQNGIGGSPGFVYINNTDNDELLHHDISNVFFIGELEPVASDTVDLIMDLTKKGKLITNIYDSDYVNTVNLVVSNTIDVSDSIIMGNLRVLHEPLVVSMKNSAAIDNTITTLDNIQPFIKHTVEKINDTIDVDGVDQDISINRFGTVVLSNGSSDTFSSRYSYITNEVTNIYTATNHNFSGDVSFNSKLFVYDDVSFNSNLDVSSAIIARNTIQMSYDDVGDRISLYNSKNENTYSIGIDSQALSFTSSTYFNFVRRATGSFTSFTGQSGSNPQPLSLQLKVHNDDKVYFLNPNGSFYFGKTVTSGTETPFVEILGDSTNNTIIKTTNNYIIRSDNLDANHLIVNSSFCRVASDLDFEVVNGNGYSSNVTKNYLKVDKSAEKVEIMSTYSDFSGNDVLEARGYIKCSGLKVMQETTTTESARLFSGNTSNVWLASTGTINFRTNGIGYATGTTIATMNTNSVQINGNTDISNGTLNFMNSSIGVKIKLNNTSMYSIGLNNSATYFSSGRYFDFIERTSSSSTNTNYKLRIDSGSTNPMIISSTDITDISGMMNFTSSSTASGSSDRIRLWNSGTSNQFAIGIASSATYLSTSNNIDFVHRSSQSVSNTTTPKLRFVVDQTSPQIHSSVVDGHIDFFRNANGTPTKYLTLSSNSINAVNLNCSGDFVIRANSIDGGVDHFTFSSSELSINTTTGFVVKNSATEYFKVDKSADKVTMTNTDISGDLNVSGTELGLGNSLKIHTPRTNTIYIGTRPTASSTTMQDTNNYTLGYECLKELSTTGGDNTRGNVAIGLSALKKAARSYLSVAIGYEALNFTTNSERCVAIGQSAGRAITGICKNNTFLGALTDFNAAGSTWENSTAVGYGAKITASNLIVLGTSNETVNVPGKIFSSGEIRSNTGIVLAPATEGTKIKLYSGTPQFSIGISSSATYISTSDHIDFVRRTTTTDTNTTAKLRFSFNQTNPKIVSSTGTTDISGNLSISGGNISFDANRKILKPGSTSIYISNQTPSDSSKDYYNYVMGNNCLTNIRTKVVGNDDQYMDSNIAMGYVALKDAIESRLSVAIGRAALRDISYSFMNTAIGFGAGQNLGSGGGFGSNNMSSGNTFLGALTEVDISNATYNFSTAVGYGATIDASNQIMLGRSSETVKIPGKLIVAGESITGSDGIMQIKKGSDHMILFALNLTSKGDYNSRTRAGNHGMFWSNTRSTGADNTSNDFVIAPWLDSTSNIGMKILNSGGIQSNTFLADSDYRLKENIQTISSDQFTVDELRPVSYTLKSNQKPALGFIAHEVQEHVPSAVSGEKDGDSMQSVDYNQLIPILVKEIQELKKRVAYLEQNQK